MDCSTGRRPKALRFWREFGGCSFGLLLCCTIRVNGLGRCRVDTSAGPALGLSGCGVMCFLLFWGGMCFLFLLVHVRFDLLRPSNLLFSLVRSYILRLSVPGYFSLFQAGPQLDCFKPARNQNLWLFQSRQTFFGEICRCVWKEPCGHQHWSRPQAL